MYYVSTVIIGYVISTLERIGNTPLVRLNKVVKSWTSVYVKAVYRNPSGSLKDRIALEMICDAETQGLLKPDYMIIEASTGNTGTALSFDGTRLGYNVEIYMPEGMTRERIRLMENYGAKVQELKLDSSSEDSIAGADYVFGSSGEGRRIVMRDIFWC